LTVASRFAAILVAVALAATPVICDAAALEGGEVPEGRWRESVPRANPLRGELTEEQLRDVERLRSIGYLTGSQPAPPVTGLTVHDASRAYRGLNLYTSGHFPGAVLMDMDGNVLHMWERSFLDVWPDRRVDAETENAQYWRYVHLFENGDLLAIFEGHGLIKIDKDSSLLWEHRGGEHHDLKVLDDGTICVLAREVSLDPRFNPEHPVLEDFILYLTPDGEEIRRVSVLEALGHSRYAVMLGEVRPQGDVLHTNALEVLNGDLAGELPAFGAGNVLVSMRTLSALAVVDMASEKVDWALKGSWRKQHDPSVLPGGNILIFDNNGNDGSSRVIEIDSASGDIECVYKGEPADDFYSQMCGAATRLPNGNTLATESDRGRAIEVTPNGDIVWEYLNPKRAGEKGELVATLFEMTRLPTDFPLDWLYDH
jgi:hypothetical protein